LIEVDIATRVVSGTEDIFIVRPGADFALYDAFIKQSRVFLDMPGFDLSPNAPFPPTATARLMAMRSIAVRDWHLADRTDKEPTRDLAAYKRKVEGRRVGKHIAGQRRLNYEMAEGTIVVVPGPDIFSDVLIGELGKFRRTISIDLYPNEHLLARDVHWLARRPKARFTPEFVESLKTRSPVTQLERSLREEVLRVAFGQYVIDGTFTARLETTTADFSTLDDYDIQTLINFVAGALLAVENGYDAEGGLSLAQALAYLRSDRSAVPDFKSNINSPGSLRLFGQSVVPLVIMMVLSAASTGQAVSAESLQARNSKSSIQKDSCALEVEAKAKAAVKIMRLDDLQAACEQFRSAEKDAGVKTSMKATVKTKGKE